MRAELGGIYYALEQVPVDEELTILTDTLSAIYLLCRSRRKRILNPYVRRAKCRDYVAAILERLQARTRTSARTTLAKVRGHNSCEINKATDRLAEKGAALPLDQGLFSESSRELGLQCVILNPNTVFSVDSGNQVGSGSLANSP